MQEVAASPFAAWESFYVIVGSSAGALTGLQFVVITLLKESRRRTTIREVEAFATPSIAHFGAVLLVSAVLSAPWRVLTNAGLVLGIAGAVGASYVALVIRRVFRQTHYRLVVEDWLWHTALPLVAYVALAAAAVALGRETHVALFVIAAAALLLLFVGIHNAWDTVTYIAIDQPETANAPRDRT